MWNTFSWIKPICHTVCWVCSSCDFKRACAHNPSISTNLVAVSPSIVKDCQPFSQNWSEFLSILQRKASASAVCSAPKHHEPSGNEFGHASGNGFVHAYTKTNVRVSERHFHCWISRNSMHLDCLCILCTNTPYSPELKDKHNLVSGKFLDFTSWPHLRDENRKSGVDCQESWKPVLSE